MFVHNWFIYLYYTKIMVNRDNIHITLTVQFLSNNNECFEYFYLNSFYLYKSSKNHNMLRKCLTVFSNTYISRSKDIHFLSNWIVITLHFHFVLYAFIGFVSHTIYESVHFQWTKSYTVEATNYFYESGSKNVCRTLGLTQRRHLPDPLKFCPLGPTGPTVSCISAWLYLILT